MTRQIHVAAPAKVNLTLDVSAKRPDGFHDIDSIVVPFAPADAITVTCNPLMENDEPIALACNDANLPLGLANLAYRAAVEFAAQVTSAQSSRISIELRKCLPFEAGLGGGSSDAAAVLLALAELFDVGSVTLSEIAAKIGSDVPLFLRKAPVRVRGRGEIVSKVAATVPQIYGVLVKPDCGVATGPAYALLDAGPRCASGSTPKLLEALASDASVAELAASLHNDFEAVVLSRYAAVAVAHAAVTSAGALRALLCGSGSAIFGLARDENHANLLTAHLMGRFPWVTPTHSYEWSASAT